MKQLIFISCLLFFMVPAKGQTKVDSLQDLFSNSDSDSVSIIILDQIGAYYVKEGDYLEAAVWLDKQLSGGYKISDAKKMNTLISVGLCYQQAQIIDKALDYFYLSRDFAIEINNQEYEALVYNNIASTYELFDIYDKSLEYHFKALEIRKKINSSKIKVSLDGIGLIYKNIYEYENAEEYFNKVLEIDSLNWTLRNLVHLYALKGEHSLAIIKAHEFIKHIRNKKNYDSLGDQLYFYQRIAVSFNNLNKIDSALFYGELVFELSKESNDVYNILQSKLTCASIYYSNKNYELAELFAAEALAEAKMIQKTALVRNSSGLLYKIFKATGNHKEALSMHELHNEKLKEIMDQQTSQKALNYKTSSIINAKEMELQQKELLSFYTRIVGLIITLVLLLISGLIYRNYRIKLNANRALSDLNDILDEKNHDIMSNITYAKKIQDALLPADKNMKKTLHDSFNLYYPKDLVSGDFYWIHSDKNDIYFAVVDCTGHGVSGAFMSIIGLTLLDEVIVKQGIKELDKVLNSMREYIITSLHQTGEAGETRDGMDIAICKLSGNKIEFAGAHNPLIIIRNNELIEIKGDAQPIGFYTGEKAPFTKHEYSLEKGDMIYVFSDGFQDQFGGPKGKKYMAGKFKKLLLRVNEQSSADQYQSLADEFQSWKGDHEQVDDVCVIGVRV